MKNLKFYEAVLRDELPISKESADKGWPPLLYPFFLACIQLPDADKPAKKAFTLAMGDSIRAGVLPAVRQRIPWFIEDDISEPHVNGQDFAAWLKTHGIDPSPLVREWFNAQKEGDGLIVKAAAREKNPLSTSERNSLLKLVIGMAIKGYSYDPGKAKNLAVADIVKDLDALGIGMDADTVRKYLGKAKNEVLPAKPSQP